MWDALSGAGNYGYYVVAATHSPFGDLTYMDLGAAYTYQHYLDYERGSRRLVGTVQTAQQADGGIDSLVKATYAWDDAGNLTSDKDVPDAANGGQPADRQCYRYDWARRLTQAWTPSNGDCVTSPTSSTVLGGGAPYWNTYNYDAIGNRTRAVTRTAIASGGTAWSSTTSTYAYPTSGPGVERPHAVTGVTATGTGAGTSSFTYDDSGNMTGRTVAGQATQALTWDAEGELANAASDQNGDGTVSDAEAADGDKYVYTADGDRLIRHQTGEQGATTTVYLPGGQELVLDSTGQVTASRYYAFEGKTVAVRSEGP